MAETSRARKGEPFSIRLTHATDRFVADEAKRTRRSKSAVVEMLTEESARMRRFPGIGFRGTDADRRAWVIGSGLDVWQIIDALDEAGGPEQLRGTTDLTDSHIRLSLAYRDHYPDEIADAIAENRRSLTELSELYPFFSVERLD